MSLRQKSASMGFLYYPKSNEVLLHLRDVKTKYNPGLWAFFGGLSEKNESPKKAFKREVKEELELEIEIENVKYLRDYFNEDFDTQRYVFYSKVNRKPEFKLMEGEKARWFSVDDAFSQNLSRRTIEDLIYFRKHILKLHSPIKAVIFDVGGVLVNTPSSLEDIEAYKKEISADERVLELARMLKKKDLKIAVLSNTIPEHVDILSKLGIFKEFDEHVFSYKVKLKKPDPKIFQLTLNLLRTNPSVTIFIDDDPNYVKVANALGIYGIRYSTLNKLGQILEELL